MQGKKCLSSGVALILLVCSLPTAAFGQAKLSGSLYALAQSGGGTL